jgi:hypothetical protein
MFFSLIWNHYVLNKIQEIIGTYFSGQ